MKHEIKLLSRIDAALDHPAWNMTFTDDISCLVLIDLALEQLQQGYVQADTLYTVPENEVFTVTHLFIKPNAQYSFLTLLQYLIFRPNPAVKYALSELLFNSESQANTQIQARAEQYGLTALPDSANKFRHLFQLAQHLFSYPEHIQKHLAVKQITVNGTNYLPISPLIAHPVMSAVLYTGDHFRKLYISFSQETQTISFFSLMDDLHRLEHLVPYYHFFQNQQAKAKQFIAQTGIVNILGDTYLGEAYTEKRKNRGMSDALQRYGYDYSFQKLQPFLGENDLNIANFEAVFACEAESYLKDKKPFILGAKAEETITEFKRNHLNHLVLANNHLKDYGEASLKYTLQQLEQSEIAYIGAGQNQLDAQAYYEITFQDKTYAIFNGYWHRDTAYLDYDFYALGNRSGVAALNGVLFEQIAYYRAHHPQHKVIVICHWGVDFKPIAKVQEKLAHVLTQLGVNLVIGHGPHTIQPVRLMNQKPVVFSIGNAVFNSNGEYDEQHALPYGCIARLNLATDQIRLYPIMIDNQRTFWQPHPVDAQDFNAAASALSSALPPHFYHTEQDDLGFYLEFGF